MADGGAIRIEPLRSDLVPAAARMLARAFVTNPLHLAASGRRGSIGTKRSFALVSR